jgi:hypothetical protein
MLKKNLLGIYKNVVTHTVSHRLDKKKLLLEFFRPATMRLLNWSEYVD